MPNVAVSQAPSCFRSSGPISRRALKIAPSLCVKHCARGSNLRASACDAQILALEQHPSRTDSLPRACTREGRPAASRFISPGGPIQRRDALPAFASFVPGPRLANLKQASRLGTRTAAVNWAWSFAGTSPSPSRFECARFFDELGDYGLDTCDANT